MRYEQADTGPHLNETEDSIMDGQLHLKVSKKLLADFIAKSELIGKSHLNLLRELMEATVESRITIKPNQHQKDLYND